METRSRRQQLVIQFSCVNRGFIKGLLNCAGLNRSGFNGEVPNGSRLNRSRGN
jgi:hypothetical protein